MQHTSRVERVGKAESGERDFVNGDRPATFDCGAVLIVVNYLRVGIDYVLNRVANIDARCNRVNGRVYIF